MPALYPLKFKYECKEAVWGGTRLTKLGKTIPEGSNCGETWELGAFQSLDSVIANGFLAGNSLSEAIEVYMYDLVGEEVFNKFGHIFPLLVKFIDTNDYLSVQVHPDDDISLKRHQKLGKTEAWFVLDAQPGAEISLGFNKDVTQEELVGHIENNTLGEILQTKSVKSGDFFFLPAGTVHAIGKGVTLCEIQQASDITYRLYDYNRPGLDGKHRDLHVEQALEVIDYSAAECFNTGYREQQVGSTELVKCDKFVINLLNVEGSYQADYTHLDSFVILICIEGSLQIEFDGGEENLSRGEVALLPAELNQISFKSNTSCKILEVYLS
jgi:mannose-6-phosphate isomerase